MFLKFSNTGDSLLATTLKHPDRLYFNDYSDLLPTPDGNLLKGGFYGDPTKTVGILIKYSSFGEILLTKEYDSVLFPEYDFLLTEDVRIKPDGGYLMLFSHDASLNPQDLDMSLLVLDTNYNQVNYLIYGTAPLHEIGSSLILDNDGGYLIGAKRTNYGQTSSGFNSRTLIIKTDSLGVEQWQWLSPVGQLQDDAQAMIRTPDGGLVVASGRGVEKWNNPNNPHWLEWDALIFKLDADRNLVWKRPLRGYWNSTNIGLTEMVAAPDGSGFVVCGISADTVGMPEGYHDSWLVKVSNHGDSLWARHYAWFDGEFVAPEAWDMKATPDSGYVVVGYSPNVGQHVPGWIMKVDKHGCLIPGCNANDGPNATTEELVEMKLAIYPNPTSDFLNFELRSPRLPQRASFRIVDANGKVVKEKKSDSPKDTFIVPVREWASGVYWLQLIDSGRVIHSEKFIKH